MTDQELVRKLFDLAKRSPMVNAQENLLLKQAAKRLDELTKARALRWADAVRRGYYGQPAYITGYQDGGLTYDSWALLYSAHCDIKDDLFAIVNAGRLWTISPDQHDDVICWSNVPTTEQIDQEQARRAEARQKKTQE